MATRFGYFSHEISPTTDWWRDHIHPDDRSRASESIDRAILEPGTGSWTCEYRFAKRDGTFAIVCDRAYILRNERGRAVRVVGAVMDLTEIKVAYCALQESEERYRYTIEVTGQIAWSADPDGQVIRFDERWSNLTGLDCFVNIRDWPRVVHSEDRANAYQRWLTALASGDALDVELRLKISDGGYRWFRTRAAAHKDESRRVERWYGTIEDIHQRKLNQLALKQLATFDELTSLRNRHSFSNDLAAALQLAATDGKSLGLLVLDIDNFKSVNDVFGHQAGDILLKLFAQRMLEAGVELYRTGGDEFATILPAADHRSLATVGEVIHGALEQPFLLGGTAVDCRASIGCALFPAHGDTAGELLKSADIALYSAKADGRGQTRFFASAMRSDLQRRNSMLEVARRALEAGDVCAFFQPKISLRTGNLVGFEALMRIRNERFGPQQPAIVAAAFNHPDLALEIADHVLADVISAAKRWRQNGFSFGRIAINASTLEFRRGDFADRLLSRLAEGGVPPNAIEVEVNESVILGGQDDTILRSLQTLEQADVTIALDDFGTGFASLSHLRLFPVNALKIDQSFVRELASDARQQQITSALINLSRTMGIQTVAEGVETREQAELLRSFGCDIGQGFLFGRALCANDAEELLRSDRAWFRATLLDELGRS